MINKTQLTELSAALKQRYGEKATRKLKTSAASAALSGVGVRKFAKRRDDFGKSVAGYHTMALKKSENDSRKRQAGLQRLVRTSVKEETDTPLDEKRDIEYLGKMKNQGVVSKVKKFVKRGFKTPEKAARKEASQESDRMARQWPSTKRGAKISHQAARNYSRLDNMHEENAMSETEELVQSIIDQKPLDTKTHFDNMMKDYLAGMMDVYKMQVAQDAFSDANTEITEPPDDESTVSDPEEELSDEEIESILADMSDEDLENLIAELDADEEQDDAPTDEVETDAGDETTDVAPDDDKTDIAESKPGKFVSYGNPKTGKKETNAERTERAKRSLKSQGIKLKDKD